jgi:hypothetical protein
VTQSFAGKTSGSCSCCPYGTLLQSTEYTEDTPAIDPLSRIIFDTCCTCLPSR